MNIIKKLLSINFSNSRLIGFSATKTIALVVVISLLITTIGNNAYAIAQTINDIQKDENTASKFSEGKITGYNDTGSVATVVNIQDLHCHYQTQQNISSIIKEIEDNYGIKAICVEGGYGQIDTGWLSNIKDEKLKQNLTEKLLEEGELTGAEYYAVKNNKKDILKGLDEEKIHKENIKRLSNIIENEDKYANIIKKVQYVINKLNNEYVNRRSRNFTDIVNEYRQDKIDTTKYYSLLWKYIDKINEEPQKYNNITKISKQDYPNISKYLQLTKNNKKVKTKQAIVELQQILTELKQKLPYSQYSDFLADTKNLKQTDKLIKYIQQYNDENKINLENYTQLNNFIKLGSINNTLNPVEMIKEETVLEDQIRKALSYNLTEYEISYITSFEKYFEKYLNYGLTCLEWKYVETGMEKFRKLYTKYAVVDRIKEIEKDFDNINKYYQANETRNSIFIDNITKYISDNKKTDIKQKRTAEQILKDSKEVIIVVSGGYHSEELKDMLSDKDINDIVITPNVLGDIDISGEKYKQIIKGQGKIQSQALAYTLASCIKNDDFKAALLYRVARSLADDETIELIEQQIINGIEENLKEKNKDKKNIDFKKKAIDEFNKIKENIENGEKNNAEKPAFNKKFEEIKETILDNIKLINFDITDVKQIDKELDKYMLEIAKFLSDRNWFFDSDGVIAKIDFSKILKDKNLMGIEPERYSNMPKSLQSALYQVELENTNAVKNQNNDKEILLKIKENQKIKKYINKDGEKEKITGNNFYFTFENEHLNLLNKDDFDKEKKENGTMFLKENIKNKLDDYRKMFVLAQEQDTVIYLSEILNEPIVIETTINGKVYDDEAVIKYDSDTDTWYLLSHEDLNAEYKEIEKSISSKLKDSFIVSEEMKKFNNETFKKELEIKKIDNVTEREKAEEKLKMLRENLDKIIESGIEYDKYENNRNITPVIDNDYERLVIIFGQAVIRANYKERKDIDEIKQDLIFKKQKNDGEEVRSEIQKIKGYGTEIVLSNICSNLYMLEDSNAEGFDLITDKEYDEDKKYLTDKGYKVQVKCLDRANFENKDDIVHKALRKFPGIPVFAPEKVAEEFKNKGDERVFPYDISEDFLYSIAEWTFANIENLDLEKINDIDLNIELKENKVSRETDSQNLLQAGSTVKLLNNIGETLGIKEFRYNDLLQQESSTVQYSTQIVSKIFKNYNIDYDEILQLSTMFLEKCQNSKITVELLEEIVGQYKSDSKYILEYLLKEENINYINKNKNNIDVMDTITDFAGYICLFLNLEKIDTSLESFVKAIDSLTVDFSLSHIEYSNDNVCNYLEDYFKKEYLKDNNETKNLFEELFKENKVYFKYREYLSIEDIKYFIGKEKNDESKNKALKNIEDICEKSLEAEKSLNNDKKQRYREDIKMFFEVCKEEKVNFSKFTNLSNITIFADKNFYDGSHYPKYIIRSFLKARQKELISFFFEDKNNMLVEIIGRNNVCLFDLMDYQSIVHFEDYLRTLSGNDINELNSLFNSLGGSGLEYTIIDNLLDYNPIINDNKGSDYFNDFFALKMFLNKDFRTTFEKRKFFKDFEGKNKTVLLYLMAVDFSHLLSPYNLDIDLNKIVNDEKHLKFYINTFFDGIDNNLSSTVIKDGAKIGLHDNSEERFNFKIKKVFEELGWVSLDEEVEKKDTLTEIAKGYAGEEISFIHDGDGDGIALYFSNNNRLIYNDFFDVFEDYFENNLVHSIVLLSCRGLRFAFNLGNKSFESGFNSIPFIIGSFYDMKDTSDGMDPFTYGLLEYLKNLKENNKEKYEEIKNNGFTVFNLIEAKLFIPHTNISIVVPNEQTNKQMVDYALKNKLLLSRSPFRINPDKASKINSEVLDYNFIYPGVINNIVNNINENIIDKGLIVNPIFSLSIFAFLKEYLENKNKNDTNIYKAVSFLDTTAPIWEEIVFRIIPMIISPVLFSVMQILFLFSHTIVRWLTDKDSAGKRKSFKDFAIKDIKNLGIPALLLTSLYIVSFVAVSIAFPVFPFAAPIAATIIQSFIAAIPATAFHYIWNNNEETIKNIFKKINEIFGTNLKYRHLSIFDVGNKNINNKLSMEELLEDISDGRIFYVEYLDEYLNETGKKERDKYIELTENKYIDMPTSVEKWFFEKIVTTNFISENFDLLVFVIDKIKYFKENLTYKDYEEQSYKLLTIFDERIDKKEVLSEFKDLIEYILKNVNIVEEIDEQISVLNNNYDFIKDNFKLVNNLYENAKISSFDSKHIKGFIEGLNLLYEHNNRYFFDISDENLVFSFDIYKDCFRYSVDKIDKTANYMFIDFILDLGKTNNGKNFINDNKDLVFDVSDKFGILAIPVLNLLIENEDILSQKNIKDVKTLCDEEQLTDALINLFTMKYNENPTSFPYNALFYLALNKNVGQFIINLDDDAKINDDYYGLIAKGNMSGLYHRISRPYQSDSSFEYMIENNKIIKNKQITNLYNKNEKFAELIDSYDENNPSFDEIKKSLIEANIVEERYFRESDVRKIVKHIKQDIQYAKLYNTISRIYNDIENEEFIKFVNSYNIDEIFKFLDKKGIMYEKNTVQNIVRDIRTKNIYEIVNDIYDNEKRLIDLVDSYDGSEAAFEHINSFLNGKNVMTDKDTLKNIIRDIKINNLLLKIDYFDFNIDNHCVSFDILLNNCKLGRITQEQKKEFVEKLSKPVFEYYNEEKEGTVIPDKKDNKRYPFDDFDKVEIKSDNYLKNKRNSLAKLYNNKEFFKSGQRENIFKNEVMAEQKLGMKNDDNDMLEIKDFEKLPNVFKQMFLDGSIKSIANLKEYVRPEFIDREDFVQDNPPYLRDLSIAEKRNINDKEEVKSIWDEFKTNYDNGEYKNADDIFESWTGFSVSEIAKNNNQSKTFVNGREYERGKIFDVYRDDILLAMVTVLKNNNENGYKEDFEKLNTNNYDFQCSLLKDGPCIMTYTQALNAGYITGDCTGKLAGGLNNKDYRNNRLFLDNFFVVGYFKGGELIQKYMCHFDEDSMHIMSMEDIPGFRPNKTNENNGYENDGGEYKNIDFEGQYFFESLDYISQIVTKINKDDKIYKDFEIEHVYIDTDSSNTQFFKDIIPFTIFKNVKDSIFGIDNKELTDKIEVEYDRYRDIMEISKKEGELSNADIKELSKILKNIKGISYQEADGYLIVKVKTSAKDNLLAQGDLDSLCEIDMDNLDLSAKAEEYKIKGSKLKILRTLAGHKYNGSILLKFETENFILNNGLIKEGLEEFSSGFVLGSELPLNDDDTIILSNKNNLKNDFINNFLELIKYLPVYKLSDNKKGFILPVGKNKKGEKQFLKFEMEGEKIIFGGKGKGIFYMESGNEKRGEISKEYQNYIGRVENLIVSRAPYQISNKHNKNKIKEEVIEAVENNVIEITNDNINILEITDDGKVSFTIEYNGKNIIKNEGYFTCTINKRYNKDLTVELIDEDNKYIDDFENQSPNILEDEEISDRIASQKVFLIGKEEDGIIKGGQLRKELEDLEQITIELPSIKTLVSSTENKTDEKKSDSLSIFEPIKETRIGLILHKNAHLWENVYFMVPAILSSFIFGSLLSVSGVTLFAGLVFLFSHTIVRWITDKDSAGKRKSFKDFAIKDIKNLGIPALLLTTLYIATFAVASIAFPVFPFAAPIATTIIQSFIAAIPATAFHYIWNNFLADKFGKRKLIIFDKKNKDVYSILMDRINESENSHRWYMTEELIDNKNWFEERKESKFIYENEDLLYVLIESLFNEGKLENLKDYLQIFDEIEKNNNEEIITGHKNLLIQKIENKEITSPQDFQKYIDLFENRDAFYDENKELIALVIYPLFKDGELTKIDEMFNLLYENREFIEQNYNLVKIIYENTTLSLEKKNSLIEKLKNDGILLLLNDIENPKQRKKLVEKLYSSSYFFKFFNSENKGTVVPDYSYNNNYYYNNEDLKLDDDISLIIKREFLAKLYDNKDLFTQTEQKKIFKNTNIAKEILEIKDFNKLNTFVKQMLLDGSIKSQANLKEYVIDFNGENINDRQNPDVARNVKVAKQRNINGVNETKILFDSFIEKDGYKNYENCNDVFMELTGFTVEQIIKNNNSFITINGRKYEKGDISEIYRDDIVYAISSVMKQKDDKEGNKRNESFNELTKKAGINYNFKCPLFDGPCLVPYSEILNSGYIIGDCTGLLAEGANNIEFRNNRIYIKNHLLIGYYKNGSLIQKYGCHFDKEDFHIFSLEDIGGFRPWKTKDKSGYWGEYKNIAFEGSYFFESINCILQFAKGKNIYIETVTSNSDYLKELANKISIKDVSTKTDSLLNQHSGIGSLRKINMEEINKIASSVDNDNIRATIVKNLDIAHKYMGRTSQNQVFGQEAYSKYLQEHELSTKGNSKVKVIDDEIVIKTEGEIYDNFMENFVEIIKYLPVYKLSGKSKGFLVSVGNESGQEQFLKFEIKENENNPINMVKDGNKLFMHEQEIEGYYELGENWNENSVIRELNKQKDNQIDFFKSEKSGQLISSSINTEDYGIEKILGINDNNEVLFRFKNKNNKKYLKDTKGNDIYFKCKIKKNEKLNVELINEEAKYKYIDGFESQLPKILEDEEILDKIASEKVFLIGNADEEGNLKGGKIQEELKELKKITITLPLEQKNEIADSSVLKEKLINNYSGLIKSFYEKCDENDTKQYELKNKIEKEFGKKIEDITAEDVAYYLVQDDQDSGLFIDVQKILEQKYEYYPYIPSFYVNGETIVRGYLNDILWFLRSIKNIKVIKNNYYQMIEINKDDKDYLLSIVNNENIDAKFRLYALNHLITNYKINLTEDDTKYIEKNIESIKTDFVNKMFSKSKNIKNNFDLKAYATGIFLLINENIYDANSKKIFNLIMENATLLPYNSEQPGAVANSMLRFVANFYEDDIENDILLCMNIAHELGHRIYTYREDDAATYTFNELFADVHSAVFIQEYEKRKKTGTFDLKKHYEENRKKYLTPSLATTNEHNTSESIIDIFNNTFSEEMDWFRLIDACKYFFVPSAQLGIVVELFEKYLKPNVPNKDYEKIDGYEREELAYNFAKNLQGWETTLDNIIEEDNIEISDKEEYESSMNKKTYYGSDKNLNPNYLRRDIPLPEHIKQIVEYYKSLSADKIDADMKRKMLIISVFDGMFSTESEKNILKLKEQIKNTDKISDEIIEKLKEYGIKVNSNIPLDGSDKDALDKEKNRLVSKLEQQSVFFSNFNFVSNIIANAYINNYDAIKSANSYENIIKLVPEIIINSGSITDYYKMSKYEMDKDVFDKYMEIIHYLQPKSANKLYKKFEMSKPKQTGKKTTKIGTSTVLLLMLSVFFNFNSAGTKESAKIFSDDNENEDEFIFKGTVYYRPTLKGEPHIYSIRDEIYDNNDKTDYKEEYITKKLEKLKEFIENEENPESLKDKGFNYAYIYYLYSNNKIDVLKKYAENEENDLKYRLFAVMYLKMLGEDISKKDKLISDFKKEISSGKYRKQIKNDFDLQAYSAGIMLIEEDNFKETISLIERDVNSNEVIGNMYKKISRSLFVIPYMSFDLFLSGDNSVNASSASQYLSYSSAYGINLKGAIMHELLHTFIEQLNKELDIELDNEIVLSTEEFLANVAKLQYSHSGGFFKRIFKNFTPWYSEENIGSDFSFIYFVEEHIFSTSLIDLFMYTTDILNEPFDGANLSNAIVKSLFSETLYKKNMSQLELRNKIFDIYLENKDEKFIEDFENTINDLDFGWQSVLYNALNYLKETDTRTYNEIIEKVKNLGIKVNLVNSSYKYSKNIEAKINAGDDKAIVSHIILTGKQPNEDILDIISTSLSKKRTDLKPLFDKDEDGQYYLSKIQNKDDFIRKMSKKIDNENVMKYLLNKTYESKWLLQLHSHSQKQSKNKSVSNNSNVEIVNKLEQLNIPVELSNLYEIIVPEIEYMIDNRYSNYSLIDYCRNEIKFLLEKNGYKNSDEIMQEIIDDFKNETQIGKRSQRIVSKKYFGDITLTDMFVLKKYNDNLSKLNEEQIEVLNEYVGKNYPFENLITEVRLGTYYYNENDKQTYEQINGDKLISLINFLLEVDDDAENKNKLLTLFRKTGKYGLERQAISTDYNCLALKIFLSDDYNEIFNNSHFKKQLNELSEDINIDDDVIKYTMAVELAKFMKDVLEIDDLYNIEISDKNIKVASEIFFNEYLRNLNYLNKELISSSKLNFIGLGAYSSHYNEGVDVYKNDKLINNLKQLEIPIQDSYLLLNYENNRFKFNEKKQSVLSDKSSVLYKKLIDNNKIKICGIGISEFETIVVNNKLKIITGYLEKMNIEVPQEIENIHDSQIKLNKLLELINNPAWSAETLYSQIKNDCIDKYGKSFDKKAFDELIADIGFKEDGKVLVREDGESLKNKIETVKNDIVENYLLLEQTNLKTDEKERLNKVLEIIDKNEKIGRNDKYLYKYKIVTIINAKNKFFDNIQNINFEDQTYMFVAGHGGINGIALDINLINSLLDKFEDYGLTEENIKHYLYLSPNEIAKAIAQSVKENINNVGVMDLSKIIIDIRSCSGAYISEEFLDELDFELKQIGKKLGLTNDQIGDISRCFVFSESTFEDEFVQSKVNGILKNGFIHSNKTHEFLFDTTLSDYLRNNNDKNNITYFDMLVIKSLTKYSGLEIFNYIPVSQKNELKQQYKDNVKNRGKYLKGKLINNNADIDDIKEMINLGLEKEVFDIILLRSKEFRYYDEFISEYFRFMLDNNKTFFENISLLGIVKLLNLFNEEHQNILRDIITIQINFDYKNDPETFEGTNVEDEINEQYNEYLEDYYLDFTDKDKFLILSLNDIEEEKNDIFENANIDINGNDNIDKNENVSIKTNRENIPIKEFFGLFGNRIILPIEAVNDMKNKDSNKILSLGRSEYRIDSDNRHSSKVRMLDAMYKDISKQWYEYYRDEDNDILEESENGTIKAKPYKLMKQINKDINDGKITNIYFFLHKNMDKEKEENESSFTFDEIKVLLEMKYSDNDEYNNIADNIINHTTLVVGTQTLLNGILKILSQHKSTIDISDVRIMTNLMNNILTDSNINKAAVLPENEGYVNKAIADGKNILRVSFGVAWKEKFNVYRAKSFYNNHKSIESRLTALFLSSISYLIPAIIAISSLLMPAIPLTTALIVFVGSIFASNLAVHTILDFKAIKTRKEMFDAISENILNVAKDEIAKQESIEKEIVVPMYVISKDLEEFLDTEEYDLINTGLKTQKGESIFAVNIDGVIVFGTRSGAGSFEVAEVLNDSKVLEDLIRDKIGENINIKFDIVVEDRNYIKQKTEKSENYNMIFEDDNIIFENGIMIVNEIKGKTQQEIINEFKSLTELKNAVGVTLADKIIISFENVADEKLKQKLETGKARKVITQEQYDKLKEDINLLDLREKGIEIYIRNDGKITDIETGEEIEIEEEITETITPAELQRKMITKKSLLIGIDQITKIFEQSDILENNSLFETLIGNFKASVGIKQLLNENVIKTIVYNKPFEYIPNEEPTQGEWTKLELENGIGDEFKEIFEETMKERINAKKVIKQVKGTAEIEQNNKNKNLEKLLIKMINKQRDININQEQLNKYEDMNGKQLTEEYNKIIKDGNANASKLIVLIPILMDERNREVEKTSKENDAQNYRAMLAAA